MASTVAVPAPSLETLEAAADANVKTDANGDQHIGSDASAAAPAPPPPKPELPATSAPSKAEKRAARAKNTSAAGASDAKPMTMEELDNELAKEARAWKRARKEPRQVSYASEKVLEHDTAVAVGINANQLTEEEEGLLPPGTDEQLYTKVRNHILAKWRADVTRWLTEEEAGAKIEARFRHLVAPAFRFLTAYGYINFGVAPQIQERQLGVAADKEAVIVIGAGLAGLAAARQLRAFGHKVMVVEGRDRPGGRVYTRRMEAEGQVAAADLGGSIVTGIDGNPLAVLARQLAIPMHEIDTTNQGFAIHLDSGAAPDPVLDDQIYREFNGLLDSLSKHRDDMGDISRCMSLGTALETMWASLYPAAATPNPTTSPGAIAPQPPAASSVDPAPPATTSGSPPAAAPAAAASTAAPPEAAAAAAADTAAAGSAAAADTAAADTAAANIAAADAAPSASASPAAAAAAAAAADPLPVTDAMDTSPDVTPLPDASGTPQLDADTPLPDVSDTILPDAADVSLTPADVVDTAMAEGAPGAEAPAAEAPAEAAPAEEAPAEEAPAEEAPAAEAPAEEAPPAEAPAAEVPVAAAAAAKAAEAPKAANAAQAAAPSSPFAAVNIAAAAAAATAATSGGDTAHELATSAPAAPAAAGGGAADGSEAPTSPPRPPSPAAPPSPSPASPARPAPTAPEPAADDSHPSTAPQSTASDAAPTPSSPPPGHSGEPPQPSTKAPPSPSPSHPADTPADAPSTASPSTNPASDPMQLDPQSASPPPPSPSGRPPTDPPEPSTASPHPSPPPHPTALPSAPPLHPGPGPKGSSRPSAPPPSPSTHPSVASADPALMRRLFDWHMANVEFANAAKAHTLSLKGWDLDDPYEFLGPHVFLPGGNLRLVAALTEGLPIMYRSIVGRVQYSQKGVALQLQDGTVLKADAALVTIPLGVLKADTVAFDPPLPARKLGAIGRLGFGLLNKVVLLFPYVFWDDRLDTFGRVVEDTDHRGEAYLFYSYAHISGGALVAALMAGSSAEALEEAEPGQAVERVMAWLRRVHEPRGITVPPPIQALCTRWGADPLARGSYSSCRVGSLGADDYDILAENVGGRVFFAGEATIKKYPATMHGAFISGLREAANISAHFAKQRATQQKGAKDGGGAPGEPSPPSEEDISGMQLLVEVAKELKRVFAAVEPDMEFGFLAALWGPPGSPHQGEALVRVDIGSMRSSSRKDLVVYTTLGRAQVLALRDVKGGDEARLALMTEAYSVKVLGRGGLEERTLQLFAAVVAARGLDVDLAALGLAQEGDEDEDMVLVAAGAGAGGSGEGGAVPEQGSVVGDVVDGMK